MDPHIWQTELQQLCQCNSFDSAGFDRGVRYRPLASVQAAMIYTKAAKIYVEVVKSYIFKFTPNVFR